LFHFHLPYVTIGLWLCF